MDDNELRSVTDVEVKELVGGVDYSASGEVPRRRLHGFDVVTVLSGIVAGSLIILALIGPWIAPHPIGTIIGSPYAPPSGHALLGTDFLGRDVLSRVLAGGRNLVLVSFAATIVATLAGTTAGLVAGFARGAADNVIMRMADVLLILPSILVLLVLATAYGGGALVLIMVVVVTHSPLLARVVRAATLQIVNRPFVEAAVARGERPIYILFKELLPNVRGTALAFSGLLFVGAVYLSASASFLGIGAAPPASDWGRMIQENFEGAQSQPWAIAVPALLLVVLAANMNLFADGVQRRFSSGSARRQRST